MKKYLQKYAFLLLFFIFFVETANGVIYMDYIGAEETGEEIKNIEIDSKPDSISSDTQQYYETSASQPAVWEGGEYFTNGDPEGFYIVIEGGWDPWSNSNSSTDLCSLQTANIGSESFNEDGEYSSIYNLTDACRLKGGVGLYIGFFGEFGIEVPDIATHLKAADIACDAEFSIDRNDDGVVSINECVDDNSKNMAYYVPYKSGELEGSITCEPQYFKGSDLNKIGIMDCYEDNSGTKIDKTKFSIKTPYFYKNQNKEKVGKGEVVKFAIFDTYYSDNDGLYDIKIYRGASTYSEKGVLEKTIFTIESAFNEDYIEKFYNYIARDTIFISALRALIALYISFLGFQFMMGKMEDPPKELIKLMLKLIFILSFTTEAGWNLYNFLVVNFFLGGLIYAVVIIGNISIKVHNPESDIYIDPNTENSLSLIFSQFDNIIRSFLSEIFLAKIFSFIPEYILGFLVFISALLLAIYFIYVILNSSFPIIISLIELTLGLIVGPIFIIFSLFKATEDMFKNWISFLSARVASMCFIFLFISIFAAIIKQKFNEFLSFPVYKILLFDFLLEKQELHDISLIDFIVLLFKWTGLVDLIFIWRYFSGNNDFFVIVIDLFVIFLFIYLFQKLMKHVGKISDKLIKIGDGESGPAPEMKTWRDFEKDTTDRSFETKDGVIGFAERYVERKLKNAIYAPSRKISERRNKKIFDLKSKYRVTKMENIDVSEITSLKDIRDTATNMNAFIETSEKRDPNSALSRVTKTRSGFNKLLSYQLNNRKAITEIDEAEDVLNTIHNEYKREEMGTEEYTAQDFIDARKELLLLSGGSPNDGTLEGYFISNYENSEIFEETMEKYSEILNDELSVTMEERVLDEMIVELEKTEEEINSKKIELLEKEIEQKKKNFNGKVESWKNKNQKKHDEEVQKLNFYIELITKKYTFANASEEERKKVEEVFGTNDENKLFSIRQLNEMLIEYKGLRRDFGKVSKNIIDKNIKTTLSSDMEMEVRTSVKNNKKRLLEEVELMKKNYLGYKAPAINLDPEKELSADVKDLTKREIKNVKDFNESLILLRGKKKELEEKRKEKEEDK